MESTPGFHLLLFSLLLLSNETSAATLKVIMKMLGLCLDFSMLHFDYYVLYKT